jgi:hypothetical protein
MFLGHHESTLKIGNMNSISHIVIPEYPSWSSKLCRRIRVCIQIHVRVQVGVEVRFGTSVVVIHVVDVVAADIRKEVLVGKRVVGRCDAVSSRAEALPKNLITLTCTGSREAGFWRPTVQSSGACRKMGWRRCSGGAMFWRQREGCVAT